MGRLAPDMVVQDATVPRSRLPDVLARIEGIQSSKVRGHARTLGPQICEVLRLAPLRNRRKVGDQVLQSRIAEGLTLWRWDDREGMGVTEYIEILEDGEPVGYPL